jgi:hypothetical protein
MTTSKHSKAGKKSTSSQVDSPVKTSPSQDREQESPEKGLVFGQSSIALLARYDRDSSSLRTPQCSLFEDLGECLQTLPRSGMMRNGKLWEQTALVRGTGGIESGLFPTHRASNPGSRRPGTGGKVLAEEVKKYPTATVSQHINREKVKKLVEEGLPLYTREHGDMGRQHGLADRIMYDEMMKLLPTAAARDGKGGYIGGRIRNGKISWDTLDVAIQAMESGKMFPTPRGSEGGTGMCGGTGSMEMINKLKESGDITDEEARSMIAGNGGQLSPLWVEWFMGYPIGWTDYEGSETP